MNMIPFFHALTVLKDTERTGWVDHKVRKPESVSDHSFRAAIMAYTLAPRFKLNRNKAMRLALFHDVCEVYCGDIPLMRKGKPFMDPQKKIAKEQASLSKLLKLLPKKDAKEIQDFFTAFKERKTKLAKFIKDIDTLELMLQAIEYQKGKRTKQPLTDFFEYAKTAFYLPAMKKIYLQALNK